MNYRDLDLNLLAALHALLNTRSVSRAAEVLHIGQPACSAALARLRDHFGDELLVTVNRRMLPTPLGLQLESPVRQAFAQAEAIATRRAGFDPKIASQRFSIVCSDMVARLVLRHVVRELEQVAPNISLTIRSVATLRSSRLPVDEALERRGADFLVLPTRYIPSGQQRMPLFSSDISCIAWAHNPYIGERLTVDQFYSLKHVAATFGDGRVVSLENEDAVDARRWRKFAVKTEYFLTLPSIIIGTNYIATVPTLLASEFACHHPLRIFPAPIALPQLNEVLVWPKHLDDDPANRWLRQLIVDCAVRHIPATRESMAA